MEDTQHRLEERLQVLERELEVVKARLSIIENIDGALEEAILHKWPVARTMGHVLPTARQALGAQAMLVRTFDEREDTVTFCEPDASAFDALDLDALCATIERDGVAEQVHEEHIFFGYRMDVTDQYLGSVVIAVTGPLGPHERQVCAAQLAAWSEQVDNYMAAVADARRKHTALRELSDALRVQILDVGLDRAIKVLASYVPYEDLVLTLMMGDRGTQAVNYRVVSPLAQVSSAAEGASQELGEHALEALDGSMEGLQETFALCEAREDALIYAVDGHTKVGRVSVGLRGESALSPFARDILDRFADYIRQRVVDFNKEWKQLSENFPQSVVRRLLLQDRYFERYMSPRERDVTIMYCDISGFTRISETVLREPELIGRLIDTWSDQVVSYIWESGGVFDKMVGDCIIGLWGPPFFEASAQETCEAALEAACRIREFTRSMMRSEAFPALRDMEPPIGVATGLNHCPLFVGTFGPDANYTGFSSGMNNAARLQGVARRDEILCMDSFVRNISEGRFSEERLASVKNVAEPLRFCAYEDGEQSSQSSRSD